MRYRQLEKMLENRASLNGQQVEELANGILNNKRDLKEAINGSIISGELGLYAELTEIYKSKYEKSKSQNP